MNKSSKFKVQSSKLREKPLVSVIMPVYNAGEFLVDAIESILQQTCQNFEFIIIDDASTDDSWEIINSYKKQYPQKIKTIRLKKNLNRGGDSCANLGYKIAKGEFIARMDADDVAHPKRLEKQMEFMTKNGKVIVLGTQAYVIDKDGKITGEKNEPTTHNNIVKNYFIYHPMIHPSVVIRKSMLPQRPYLYKIKHNANNDLLTFFELLQYGEFANLPDKLMFYRIHGKNDSLMRPKEKFFNTLRIRLYAWQHFGYKPEIKAVLLTLLQSLIVLTMPSNTIMSLYMFWRGVSKLKVSFANVLYSGSYS